MELDLTFMGEVENELKKAEKKFPDWPLDAVHAAAIVCEETGEMLQAALDFHYGRTDHIGHMYKEAAQAAAMLKRFIEHIGRYEQGGYDGATKKD